MKKFKNLSKRALALVVSVMMCMGILQVNALAAVTVEAKAICGLEEHTHVDECYRTCKFDEGDEEEKQVPHVHTDACYVAGDPVLNCTRTEADMDEVTVSHEHTDACYDGNGELICNLEEGSEETKQVPHVHTEACYAAGDPVLNCGLTEADMDVVTVSHVHTDDCYVSKAQCGLEEHTHNKSCGFADVSFEEIKTALTSDGDVTLILNGTTLNLSEQIRVEGANQKLTIDEGVVAGGTIQQDNGWGRVICIVDGGSVTLNGSTTLIGSNSTLSAVYVGGEKSSFTMNGGTITGSTTSSSTDGAGVLVEKGTFTMTGGAITGNTSGANGGGVAVKDGATFEMTGGEISGNISAEDGGGVYVDNGTFTMTGGTISGNTATTIEDSYLENGDPGGQGGGVYVTGKDGKFELKGGTISGNQAGEGGGIFINNDNGQKSTFTMTGGTVTENIAKLGEGGGIYIFGTGKITAGEITKNETHTTADLGGGGIYIETDGDLQILNAIITENEAKGLGGGIAACVHGKTVVYVKDGAAIFDNKADGNAHSYGHTKFDPAGNGKFIDGYDLWENDTDFVNNAQDVFTASSSEEQNRQGYPGVIVGTQMLGGGDAGWTVSGFMFQYDEEGNLVTDEDGNPEYFPVEIDKDGGIVYSNRLLGMTAKPSNEAIQEAQEAARIAAGKGVLIKGNSSETHGGGIGNNGVLTIGEGSFEGTTETNVDLSKTLIAEDAENSASEDRVLKNEEFTFVVTEEHQEGKEPKSFVGTNDANGNVSIQFPEGYFTQAGTYTFYVTEENTGDSSIKYDETVYKVTIVVTETTKTYTIGEKNVTVVVLNVESTTYEKQVTEADGTVRFEEVDGIRFVNTYTTPETPNDPRVSLTITKAVVGGGDAVADKEYSFTVTSSDVAGFEEQHFTLKAGGLKEITGLKKGTYTVTEDDASVEGYTWTVSGTGVVDMTNGGDATVTVTNTYTEEEPEKGSLTITKAVVGGGDAVADKDYTFTVTSDVEGFEEQSFALKAGETKTISDLDAGMYTVTEDDASVEGYTWTVSGVGGVEVAAGGSADVTVTNTYTELEPEKGSLTITKAVVGGGAAAANKEYTFTVAGPDGYSEAVSIVGSGSAALTGLEPGAYTVTEDSAEISGYTWTVSGAGEVTVTAGASANVTVTNTYSEIPEEPTPEIPNNPEEPTPTPTPEIPTPEPEIPVVPEVEVPDEPTPLEDLPELPVVSDDTIVETPEEPVVDLDDTPVPLSEPLVTEPEPEAEILEELPEDPVPLSDIPATGDISLLWYLTVAFSAAGLLILKVLGKKHEEEQA